MIATHINPSIVKSDPVYSKQLKKEILGIHDKKAPRKAEDAVDFKKERDEK